MTKRILLADDEPNLLKMLGYALHQEGFEVSVAQTGSDALHKALTEKPALAVLDGNMPEMDGLEVCARIRENPETHDMLVIILTARNQTTDKVAGLQAGADEYVTKPVELTEMIARIKALLASGDRLKEGGKSGGSGRGRVLTMLGTKGGVGTSTVALNVAAALANEGYDVIAAELRAFFGDYAAWLNLKPKTTIESLLNLTTAEVNATTVSHALVEAAPNLRLLCGPSTGHIMQDFFPEQAKAMIEGMAAQSAFTILDLPSYPTPVTRAAAEVSDYVSLIIGPEQMGFAAGRAMLDLLYGWGVPAEKVGLVLVTKSLLTKYAPLRPQDIASILNVTPVGYIPPIDEALQHAMTVVSHPDLDSSRLLSGLALRLGQPKVLPMTAS